MKRLLAAILIMTGAGPIGAQTKDFFELVRRGTPEQIRTAVSMGADVNARDSDDWTPLMDAADYNPSSEVIATLLKAGADVNAWDTLGMTALNWAAMHNQNPKVIATLLKAGADPEARDIGGD